MQQLYIGWRVRGFRRAYEMAKKYDLSSEAQYRLNVLHWYHNEGNSNISLTGRHFGLHRNTVSKWVKKFDPYNLKSLEPEKRIPIHTYKGHPVTYEHRTIVLKKKYPYYGKEKLKILLKREGIYVSSSWIGKIIKKHKLQYLWRTKESACNFKKTIRRRKSRKRPPKLSVPEKVGTWLQLDTIVLYSEGKSVYVITAVDLTSRFSIAYAYPSPSSSNAKDFLKKVKNFFPDNISIKMMALNSLNISIQSVKNRRLNIHSHILNALSRILM